MLHEQTGVGVVVMPFIFEQDANTGNNKSLLRTFCQAKAPKMKMKPKFVILKQPSYIITDDNMQKSCARVVSHPICLGSLLAFAFAYSSYRSTFVCVFFFFSLFHPRILCRSLCYLGSCSVCFNTHCILSQQLYILPFSNIHLRFWFRHTVKSHK